MKIELTEEERKYLLRICEEWKNSIEITIPRVGKDYVRGHLEKKISIINKLSEKKGEK